MLRRPPRSTRTDHSFPTRRSSDLRGSRVGDGVLLRLLVGLDELLRDLGMALHEALRRHQRQAVAFEAVFRPGDRSEEHTSELQSLMRISYAVFCLKKKRHIKHNHQH